MLDQKVGSTVPRRQLGRCLKEARLAARLTVRAAAQALEWSEAKMWRIETGKSAMRGHDVELMCRIYGVGADQTKALSALAKEGKTPGWWHSYGGAVPSWFDVYVDLEGATRKLCTYQPELVPGLFQTAAYARVIIGDHDPEHVEQKVLLRMRRQSLITRPHDPTHIDAVINEAVLRRSIGGPAVMAAQCRKLVEMSELPNVTLRVVPFAAGMHPGVSSGPFVIMRFPVNGDGTEVEPPIVFVAGYTGALYLEQPHELQRFDDAFRDMVTVAGDPDGRRSRELLYEAMKEHGR